MPIVDHKSCYNAQSLDTADTVDLQVDQMIVDLVHFDYIRSDSAHPDTGHFYIDLDFVLGDKVRYYNHRYGPLLSLPKQYKCLNINNILFLVKMTRDLFSMLTTKKLHYFCQDFSNLILWLILLCKFVLV